LAKNGKSRDRLITRRRVLKASIAAAATGAGVGLYTWLVEPHWLEIVKRPLPIRGLSPALRGRTLAQLSDLHVGPQVSDTYVLDTFTRVAELRPDIVVYTGDFTSYNTNVYAHAARIYRDAPRGRLATFGILGNHDYGPNWAHPDVAARLAAQLEGNGIRVLRNEVAEVEGLQVAGMDELWAHRFDPVRTLAALEANRPSLVLSHNPDTVDRPGWDTYHGWVLSGHTHGGQCKPPFLPPPLLPVQNTRYTCGEFELSGDRKLYINRGVGHLIQVRINVRPEVTLFELQNA
jgi:predicted MPP superfamily phosphohydrolase